MSASCSDLPELLVAEPPATLDTLVLERALGVFQRCVRPTGDVERPARARALGPPETSPLLSLVRS
jgi:hypothetical protein